MRRRLKLPLIIPDELHRNAPEVHALGPEHTGSTLIQLALRRIGLDGLSDCDVLDVGCGVRFTQAIINRDIPIKSYTGIDVYLPLIEYLSREVDDPRFSYAHWPVENGRYNPGGVKMTPEANLPIEGTFDVIWLFSVFTHLDPADADSLLAILRRYIRPAGVLFFSAFLDNSVDDFEAKIPEQPLDYPCYSEKYMRHLATKNGWIVSSINGPEEFIQHHLVCRVAPE
jgi:SAM-dependent methyltransferase